MFYNRVISRIMAHVSRVSLTGLCTLEGVWEYCFLCLLSGLDFF